MRRSIHWLPYYVILVGFVLGPNESSAVPSHYHISGSTIDYGGESDSTRRGLRSITESLRRIETFLQTAYERSDARLSGSAVAAVGYFFRDSPLGSGYEG